MPRYKGIALAAMAEIMLHFCEDHARRPCRTIYGLLNQRTNVMHMRDRLPANACPD
jgi:hypothetical protein